MSDEFAKKIIEDFPLLKVGGLAYLDTAATSQTPQVVLNAMNNYYTKFRANIHRGLYAISEEATAQYEQARKDVAGFIGAQEDEIIFTAGATASSNMLIYSLEQTLELHAGDEIVTTIMEHHASLVPLQELAKRKQLVLKHISITKDLELDYESAQKLITPKTKIVSVMLASNVTGTINDVAQIAKKAHDVGAVVIVDATAAVGHISVDVKKLDADFIYFSGHKMCGPTGVGVLYGKKERLEILHPSFFGGGMIDSVTKNDATWAKDISRFEAGTPNIAGVIGLGCAVNYLQTVDIEKIHEHVREVFSYAYEKLSEIKGMKLLCEKYPQKNVGIISFDVDGVHSHDMAQILAGEKVAVRAGHHCAMPLIQEISVVSTVRASFYFYSTKADVDALVSAIKKAQDIFSK
jgi:cysteine desulfurase/selenocysteine lyase